MFSLLKTALFAITTALVATVQCDYVIDPNSVPLATRNNWCASQTQTCPAICQDMGSTGASINTCNAVSLTAQCLCNDNRTPNSSEYSLTLAYFICGEFVRDCVVACNGATTCQGACATDNPCGAQSPKVYNTTASASSAADTSTPTADSSTVFGGIGEEPSAAGPQAFELARLYAALTSLSLFAVGFMYLL